MPLRPAHPSTAATLPGPADREHFADAQRRHRRAGRWYTAVSALGMLLMGVPLAAAIAPVLLLAAWIGTDVVNLATPVPVLGDVLRRLDVVGIVAAVLVPGAVVHVAAWLAVRRLFARAGSGAALSLGARDPRPDDLEERQLVNVVDGVAIACGIKAPRVQLIDSDAANAAVVGPDVDDATLVVTTGLLTTLGRDETQAVLALAIGSAGNGDLVMGTTIASAQQTTGMMSTLLSVPTSARSRQMIGRLVRLLTHPGRAQERSGLELADLVAYTEPDEDVGRQSRVLRVVLLPVTLAGGVYSLMRSFYTSLLVDPVLRRGWRARKLLADATAVELTRYPDALARAFAKLATTADLLPRAAWAAHLFVVGPEAVLAKNTAVLQQQLDGHRGLGGGLAVLADTEAMAALAAMAEVANAASFHPPLGDRVAAVRRLGASGEATDWAPTGPRRRHRAIAVLIAPVRLVSFLFQLGVPLFALAVAVFLGVIYVVPVTALAHHLLRSAA